jgi:hypothetical protein
MYWASVHRGEDLPYGPLMALLCCSARASAQHPYWQCYTRSRRRDHSGKYGGSTERGIAMVTHSRKNRALCGNG